MLKFILVVSVLCHCGSFASDVFFPDRPTVQYFTEVWYNKTLSKLMEVLTIPQMLERYVSTDEGIFKHVKRDPVLGFSWGNCGSGSDPVKIKTLSLSPDPLKLPGTVNISFDITIDLDIAPPLVLELTIKKKVAFMWIEIPCIEQQGSCAYSDFCTILPADCPPDFIKYNIPCHCPASQGEYNLPQGQIDLPSLPLPSWATHGDYKIKAVARLGGTQLFCYDITASLA